MFAFAVRKKAPSVAISLVCLSCSPDVGPSPWGSGGTVASGGFTTGGGGGSPDSTATGGAPSTDAGGRAGSTQDGGALQQYATWYSALDNVNSPILGFMF